MAEMDRRRALATGALGITTFSLPAASAAATFVPPDEVSAPSSPVTGADASAQTAGSDLRIQLAVPAGTGTHAYWVWRDTATRPDDPIGTPDGYADDGDDFISIAELDLTQHHVVEVTHTNGAGSATSTLTLTGRVLTVSGGDGSTAADGAAAAGGSGGIGVSDDATIPSTPAGYGPSGVWFDLIGGSGGNGGRDGTSASGGSFGAGARIKGSLPVQAGDVLTLHAGGGGGDGAGDANNVGAYGRGGGSTHPEGYDGGDGGHPGDEGFSGGGGGGGAATVLTRTRSGTGYDVVAAGGGGGGGTGNSVRADLDARDFAVADTASSTNGGAGQDVADGEEAIGTSRDDTSGPYVVPSTVDDGDGNGRRDGGGGGGGGGGLDGGGRGTLYYVSSLPEFFGRGGRRGRSSVTLDDLTVDEPAETSGTRRSGGEGTIRYHTITVSHG